MSELTKGPWKAKRLATYQEPGWVVVWPDKGGTYMRRLDSNGNFTGPDNDLSPAAADESIWGNLTGVRGDLSGVTGEDTHP